MFRNSWKASLSDENGVIYALDIDEAEKLDKLEHRSKYRVSLILASNRFRISASFSSRILCVITVTVHCSISIKMSMRQRQLGSGSMFPYVFLTVNLRAPFKGRISLTKVNGLSCQLAFLSLTPSVL